MHKTTLKFIAEKLLTFFNGDWRHNKLQHYCWMDDGTASGKRCHDSDAAVRKDAKIHLGLVKSESIDKLQKPSKNDWETVSTANRRIQLGTNLHNCLGYGLTRSGNNLLIIKNKLFHSDFVQIKQCFCNKT